MTSTRGVGECWNMKQGEQISYYLWYKIFEINSKKEDEAVYLIIWQEAKQLLFKKILTMLSHTKSYDIPVTNFGIFRYANNFKTCSRIHSK